MAQIQAQSEFKLTNKPTDFQLTSVKDPVKVMEWMNRLCNALKHDPGNQVLIDLVNAHTDDAISTGENMITDFQDDEWQKPPKPAHTDYTDTDHCDEVRSFLKTLNEQAKVSSIGTKQQALLMSKRLAHAATLLGKIGNGSDPNHQTSTCNYTTMEAMLESEAPDAKKIVTPYNQFSQANTTADEKMYRFLRATLVAGEAQVLANRFSRQQSGVQLMILMYRMYGTKIHEVRMKWVSALYRLPTNASKTEVTEVFENIVNGKTSIYDIIVCKLIDNNQKNQTNLESIKKFMDDREFNPQKMANLLERLFKTDELVGQHKVANSFFANFIDNRIEIPEPTVNAIHSNKSSDSQQPTCTRCKRRHPTEVCYATRTIDGHWIESEPNKPWPHERENRDTASSGRNDKPNKHNKHKKGMPSRVAASTSPSHKHPCVSESLCEMLGNSHHPLFGG